MRHTSLTIPDHLHFHVARVPDESLDIYPIVPEGHARLRSTTLVGPGKLLRSLHHAHPASSTTRKGFEQDSASRLRRAQKDLSLFQRGRARCSGNDRNALISGQSASLPLVAKEFEHIGLRSHKDQPGFRTSTRKRGLLTQKAIAGMNGIAARRPRNGHKLLAIQVRGGSSPSQGVRLICLANVQSARVIFRKNSH